MMIVFFLCVVAKMALNILNVTIIFSFNITTGLLRFEHYEGNAGLERLEHHNGNVVY